MSLVEGLRLRAFGDEKQKKITLANTLLGASNVISGLGHFLVSKK